MEAVTPQVKAENISKILYPEDSTKVGKELRLEQQYFFVSASPARRHPRLPRARTHDFPERSSPTPTR